MSSRPERYQLAYDWFTELDEGQPAKEIAEILGVSTKTVRNWRKNPRPTWTQRTRVSQAKLDAARKLLEDGASYYESARTVGVASETLRHYFPGMGWSSEQVIDYMVTMRKFNQKMRKAGI